MGRIVIITGCPGTGKSTAAAQAASHSALEKSVYLHTDTFYAALRKGAIPPWMPASDTQNRVVIEAFLAAARRFADGSYEVIVDGVVGPWMRCWHKKNPALCRVFLLQKGLLGVHIFVQ